jgi:hypothetical protein
MMLKKIMTVTALTLALGGYAHAQDSLYDDTSGGSAGQSIQSQIPGSEYDMGMGNVGEQQMVRADCKVGNPAYPQGQSATQQSNDNTPTTASISASGAVLICDMMTGG